MHACKQAFPTLPTHCTLTASGLTVSDTEVVSPGCCPVPMMALLLLVVRAPTGRRCHRCSTVSSAGAVARACRAALPPIFRRCRSAWQQVLAECCVGAKAPLRAHSFRYTRTLPASLPALVLQRYPTLLTQPQWTRLLSESHRRSFGVLPNQLEGRFLVAFARPTPPAPP